MRPERERLTWPEVAAIATVLAAVVAIIAIIAG